VSPDNQRALTQALSELGRRIKAARPDALVVISPDHWVNFFIDNLPAICVGMGEEHEGPAEPWMKDCPYKKIAGHPKLANHIVQTALERDFERRCPITSLSTTGSAFRSGAGGSTPCRPSCRSYSTISSHRSLRCAAA